MFYCRDMCGDDNIIMKDRNTTSFCTSQHLYWLWTMTTWIAILLTTYGVTKTTSINCNQLLNKWHLANQKHRIFFGILRGGGSCQQHFTGQHEWVGFSDIFPCNTQWITTHHDSQIHKFVTYCFTRNRKWYQYTAHYDIRYCYSQHMNQATV